MKKLLLALSVLVLSTCTLINARADFKKEHTGLKEMLRTVYSMLDYLLTITNESSNEDSARMQEAINAIVATSDMDKIPVVINCIDVLLKDSNNTAIRSVMLRHIQEQLIEYNNHLMDMELVNSSQISELYTHLEIAQ